MLRLFLLLLALPAYGQISCFPASSCTGGGSPGGAAGGALTGTYPSPGLANPNAANGPVVLNSSGGFAVGRGNRGVCIGDSITAGNGGTPWCLTAAGQVGVLSKGSVYTIYNAGVSGNTTAQMLARFQSDVCAYSPNWVTILGGTNDALQTIPLATTKANLLAMIQAARQCGAQPIIGTIPPNNGSTYHTAIAQINAVIRSLAVSQMITLVDFFSVLVDPSSDNYLAGYNFDATHPNTIGYMAMANQFITATSTIFSPFTGLLGYASSDGLNMVANPVFLVPGSGVPTSWGYAYGNAPTPTITTVTGDPSIIGDWMQISQPLGTAGQFSIISAAGISTGFAVGDKIACSFRVKSSGVASSGGAALGVQFFTVGQYDVFQYAAEISDGTVYIEIPVPVGVSTINPSIIINAGTSGTAIYKIGQFSMVDLTALGL